MKLEVGPWICDTCGEKIELPDQGWVEWKQNSDMKAYGFKIVHHPLYSPYKPDGNCYTIDQRDSIGTHLDRYLGFDGMSLLLSLLDLGKFTEETYSGPRVKDIREFLELFRRIQFPYYEQVRMYLEEEIAAGRQAGNSAASVYAPTFLKEIFDEHLNDH